MKGEPTTAAPKALDLIDDATLTLSKLRMIAEGISAMMAACAKAEDVDDRAVYSGMDILMQEFGDRCESASDLASKAFEMARGKKGAR
jgi:hypothetical protein